MDISTEEYFGELRTMFLTTGWQYLKEELALAAAPLNSVANVSNEKELFYAQGQLVVLNNLLNLEASIEQAEAEQSAQEASPLDLEE
jgi:hypothetical protein